MFRKNSIAVPYLHGYKFKIQIHRRLFMNPILTFQEETFSVSDLGPLTSTPDLIPGLNVQNKTNFYLEEDDEIFEGYGKLFNSFPYRQYDCYNRSLHKKQIRTAVLENDFLKATFLPGLGGRLWALIDKTTDKNLLYTNDVIRPSNLAVRNAWFSGGVEWNISMIGHTPFTMEPLFTASLETDNGTPVLRMYEYERVRKVTYQMDFWLEEDSRFLNCRMRIFNQTDQVVPMYWWSNMAVPEYENGRIIVPAMEAYTNREDGVHKVSVPVVDGADISRYKEIPNQVDYFFNIPKEAPKYIANINKDGYGLLHLSTSRLVSRKLFSWGKNEASDNWQDFLTEHAGRYVEIQAGLGKTQYGCIPMAPHTAWEWLELYGPVQTAPDAVSVSYDLALQDMNQIVEKHFEQLHPEALLVSSKKHAKKPAKLVYCGSGYGALENAIRIHRGEPALSTQLDFGTLSEEYQEWMTFLDTGIFPKKDPEEIPYDFMTDEALIEKLKATIKTKNQENWYAFYQLGLYYFVNDEMEPAAHCLTTSASLEPNPWAYHVLSVIYLKNGEKQSAADLILKGFCMRKEDLSYLKETLKILLLADCCEEIKNIYRTLPEHFANESRVLFCHLIALARTGQEKQVLDYLNEHHLILDDLRECESSLGTLWEEVHEKVHGEKGALPAKYNYLSL